MTDPSRHPTPWTISYSPTGHGGRILDSHGDALEIVHAITETDLYDYAAAQYGPPLPNPAGTHTSPPRYDPPPATKQDPR